MVSWNDAARLRSCFPTSYGAQAEMNESVESEALVIPSSRGRPEAGRPFMITRSFSSMNRKRCPANLLPLSERGKGAFTGRPPLNSLRA